MKNEKWLLVWTFYQNWNVHFNVKNIASLIYKLKTWLKMLLDDDHFTKFYKKQASGRRLRSLFYGAMVHGFLNFMNFRKYK